MLPEKRPERHESIAVHDVMVLRWRDRVASRPSLPLGSPSHDTLAPSSDRPYRTHPNGPRKLLTAWKRVGPFPDHSSPYTSSGSPSDSLSDTSSVHSLGFDASGLIHSGPSTRVASSRPYRKRCRSPTTFVPSSTPVSRSIAPTHADLLPPRKRFRDSYSPEDSREEHMEIGTAVAETVVDLGIGDGVGAHIEDGLGMGIEIVASDIKEAKASAGGKVEVEVDLRVRPVIEEDVHDHVTADRAVEVIETAQRQLEAGQLLASRERVGLDDRIRKLGRENLRICRDHDDARRRFRWLESFVERRLGFCPYQSQNGSDGDNGNGGNGNGGNGNDGNTRNGNGENGNGRNGNGNHGDGGNNENGNLNENGRGASLYHAQ
ncbi:hypothetical protein Tco_1403765, partial [Tanacetum coccineum]